ncbi:MAG TPA: threonine dehydratase [Xanthobacteraceae bacterium]|nr:threonine dehydratase [Xanthobacteraceae bacterium]
MFTLAELENVLPLVRASVPPTLQYAWPLLKARAGVEVVVKHENHTPIGAFKVRGGIVYFDRLRRERPQVRGIVTATRGNHGQSLAFAGARAGVAVTIVVPHGNSTEKNAAMRALGAELIEHGRDFDEAKEEAARIAAERGLEYAPAFHRDFVVGVATYAYELFTAFGDLDAVYVPIGLGSGICGMIGTRDLLGLNARIVGVVAAAANTYGRSLAAGRIVPTDSALTFADGIAVRAPDATALEFIRRGADRIVEVSEDEIAEAVRIIYSATHSCAEGAGAAALAALIKEPTRPHGGRVAVILSGQNIDRAWMQTVLAGGTPTAC